MIKEQAEISDLFFIHCVHFFKFIPRMKLQSHLKNFEIKKVIKNEVKINLCYLESSIKLTKPLHKQRVVRIVFLLIEDTMHENIDYFSFLLLFKRHFH